MPEEPSHGHHFVPQRGMPIDIVDDGTLCPLLLWKYMLKYDFARYYGHFHRNYAPFVKLILCGQGQMMPENVAACAKAITLIRPEVDNCCYRCMCEGEAPRANKFEVNHGTCRPSAQTALGPGVGGQ